MILFHLFRFLCGGTSYVGLVLSILMRWLKGLATQLALDCGCNDVSRHTTCVKENTWKCGELKLCFSPSAG